MRQANYDLPCTPTQPDWLHEPTKVVVYLDGMSRALHYSTDTDGLARKIRAPKSLSAVAFFDPDGKLDTVFNCANLPQRH